MESLTPLAHANKEDEKVKDQLIFGQNID